MNRDFPCQPSASSWNHPSTLCFPEFSFSFWLSVTGLFHSYKCPPSSFVLLQMAGFPSFSKTEWHSTVCIHHIFFINSSSHGHWAVFLCCLLCIMLQWTWGCRYLLDILVLSPLYINLNEWLLDFMIVLNNLGGTSILFSIMATPFYITTGYKTGYKSSTSSHPCQHPLIFFL